MSDALMTTYKLVWDDFCSWYLEIIKPEFINGNSLPIDKLTHDSTILFLEAILKIIHPWMPFISEEIWHLIKLRQEKECIIIETWPKSIQKIDTKLIFEFEKSKEIVTIIRNVRSQKKISPKEKLKLIENSDEKSTYFNSTIIKLANLSEFIFSKEKPEFTFSFLVNNIEFSIPLVNNLNTIEEKERLKKELDYNKGFLKSIQIKLLNEKFVTNAKSEIIAIEQKKEQDTLSKIKKIQIQLEKLN